MYKEIRDDCLISRKCKLLGGIVFTNLPSKGNALPSNIRYTIRVIGRGEIRRTTRLFRWFNTRTPRKFERYGAYIATLVY